MVESFKKNNVSVGKEDIIDKDYINKQPLYEILETYKPIEKERRSRTIDKNKRELIHRFVESHVENQEKHRRKQHRGKFPVPTTVNVNPSLVKPLGIYLGANPSNLVCRSEKPFEPVSRLYKKKYKDVHKIARTNTFQRTAQHAFQSKSRSPAARKNDKSARQRSKRNSQVSYKYQHIN